MKLTWLLDSTSISAKARLVMAQADAMSARGHRARIVASDDEVTWRSSSAEWVYIDDLRHYDARDDDFVSDGALPVIIVDEELYRLVTPQEHEPPRVLLCGNAQAGLQDGYGAVAHARWFHQKLDLIRVSQWAPSREEPLESVQEFHVALTTAEMMRLMHSCDVTIAPVNGLAAAEAMASGIPCLGFTPEDNAVELGERLIEMLSDFELRERMRARGREEAEQWRAANAAERLEELIRRSRPDVTRS